MAADAGETGQKGRKQTPLITFSAEKQRQANSQLWLLRHA
jgi:hypothetical protein